MKCELDHSIFPGSGISALAVTPGGQILVGCIFGGTDGGFYLEEFNANGSVNTSFGTAGEASLPVLGAMGDGDLLVPMAIEPDGQIVVGGDGYTSEGGSSFYVGRFNASGSVDTNFGSAGVVTVSGFSNGLSMNLMSSGKLVVVGQASSSSLMLQQFNTLATSQTYYAEYDANYNITSLTNSSGTVVERYVYSAYGIVTVLNADGTVRGDGTGVSSFAASDYLYQGMRYSGSTGTYASETRIYSPSLGRWLTEDPTGVAGSGIDLYQDDENDPVTYTDPSGLAASSPHDFNDLSLMVAYNKQLSEAVLLAAVIREQEVRLRGLEIYSDRNCKTDFIRQEKDGGDIDFMDVSNVFTTAISQININLGVTTADSHQTMFTEFGPFSELESEGFTLSAFEALGRVSDGFALLGVAMDYNDFRNSFDSGDGWDAYAHGMHGVIGAVSFWFPPLGIALGVSDMLGYSIKEQMLSDAQDYADKQFGEGCDVVELEIKQLRTALRHEGRVFRDMQSRLQQLVWRDTDGPASITNSADLTSSGTLYSKDAIAPVQLKNYVP